MAEGIRAETTPETITQDARSVIMMRTLNIQYIHTYIYWGEEGTGEFEDSIPEVIALVPDFSFQPIIFSCPATRHQNTESLSPQAPSIAIASQSASLPILRTCGAYFGDQPIIIVP